MRGIKPISHPQLYVHSIRLQPMKSYPSSSSKIDWEGYVHPKDCRSLDVSSSTQLPSKTNSYWTRCSHLWVLELSPTLPYSRSHSPSLTPRSQAKPMFPRSYSVPEDRSCNCILVPVAVPIPAFFEGDFHTPLPPVLLFVVGSSTSIALWLWGGTFTHARSYHRKYPFFCTM